MCTNLRPSLPSRKATQPSVSAKRVWSLPMPTLSPGCHLVPRWRTMMLPALARCPPNSLTPRRLLSLSRPLREEPPAFLCAISKALLFRLGGGFLGRGLSRCSIFCRWLRGLGRRSFLLCLGLFGLGLFGLGRSRFGLRSFGRGLGLGRPLGLARDSLVRLGS